MTVFNVCFNGFFSWTISVRQYRMAEPFWILMKQEMMGGVSWTMYENHLLFAPDRYHTSTLSLNF